MLRKFALAAAFVLTALLVSAPAQAAVTCTYSSAQARVNVALSTPLDVVTLSRSGFKIQADGTGFPTAQCGAATVKNTNAIYVTADASQQTVTITLTAGAFAPGKTKESRGTSEIEFVVNLGGSTDTVSVIGGATAETFRLGTGGMNLNSDGDADLLPTGVDTWQVLGLGGNDTISGAGGFGTGGRYGGPLGLYGGDGADVLVGGSGQDTLFGEGGHDTLNGGPGADSLSGHAGRDRLDGGDGPDNLTPGPGNDRATGGLGSDVVYAEIGADGADDVRGGPGSDFAYYYQRTGNLKMTLDDKANDGLNGEKDNVHSDIEYLYSGSGNDTLIGNSGPNSLDGGNGNDVIDGGAGNDSLTGGYGAASGNDTMRGGTGEDSLTGSDGNDSLDGGAGEDQLYGDLGNDTVNGGAGDDSLQEDSVANGADILTGGGGHDFLGYSSRSAAIQIRLDGVANDGAAGELDNISGDIESFYGGSNNDIFVGNSLANRFFGQAGLDNASGGAGEDRLYGGPGIDTLTGEDGTDYLYGDADNDILAAVDGGYDELYGGTGTDTCNGDVVDFKTDCP